jgi:hypothetical protein
MELVIFPVQDVGESYLFSTGGGGEIENWYAYLIAGEILSNKWQHDGEQFKRSHSNTKLPPCGKLWGSCGKCVRKKYLITFRSVLMSLLLKLLVKMNCWPTSQCDKVRCIYPRGAADGNNEKEPAVSQECNRSRG